MVLPTPDELVSWIQDNPDLASKREIRRAFGVTSSEQGKLHQMLRDLRGRAATTYKRAHIVAIDSDGVLVAQLDDGSSLRIEDPKGRLGLHDEALIAQGPTQTRIIRKIEKQNARFVARVTIASHEIFLTELSKSAAQRYRVKLLPPDLVDGDIVEAEPTHAPKGRSGSRHLAMARVIKRIGSAFDKNILSEISVQEYGIHDSFPPSLQDVRYAMAKAKRDDLTSLDFITIDPKDARDHDDAVFVEILPDGGFWLYVAIADVSAYVPYGSDTDLEARLRGNSTYFPDRVLSMLPEILSTDLCSLNLDQERPVLYAKMHVDTEGHISQEHFSRGTIKVKAALDYETAQSIHDAQEKTHPQNTQITQLYACFRALKMAAERRRVLHLDLPEQEINLDPYGQITSISQKTRLDSHRLIEEMMIAANVAAAKIIETHEAKALFRIHEVPTPERIETLRLIARNLGYKMSRSSHIDTQTLNAVLDFAATKPELSGIGMRVLRTLQQARYADSNKGHFGLSLARYMHFTSPIRRYADLVVHRALIAALSLGEDGVILDDVELVETAAHISKTERISINAERDCKSRFLASYFEKSIGKTYMGRISGLGRFGLFITLDDTFADGFVPARTMDDHYIYDKVKDCLRGRRYGRLFTLGDPVEVKIMSTHVLTGGIDLGLVRHKGEFMAEPSPRKGAKGRRRK